MDRRKIPFLCYWNGCIKDGPDGPFYQGSSPRVIRVGSKTSLPKLLDDLHRVTGFEKGKFQIDLIGRYPCIVQQPMVKYIRLPVVDESSLETMLEVPVYYPSITNVELYLEVKPVSEEGIEESMVADTCGDNGTADMKTPGPTKVPSDSVSKQLMFSSSWLDARELHVGMLFRDKYDLDKAVKLYSDRRQREYSVYSYPSRGTLEFQCKSYCGWVLKVAETKSNNGFEIIEFAGPHTCEPADVGSDFLAGELQGLIKAQPSLSTEELINWVKEEFGYTVSGENMWNAKKKAITSILGDLDKSLSVFPKFMAALCSANKMVMDWQYDPSPKDASFRSVFWAFHQSVEGFPHLRPLIMVDTVDLSGKYAAKMLVATGADAGNQLFPLAFAIVTQESLSAESWRWFFSCIRKKVTQREGLCLITSPDPDIVEVVNEPECQWACHRFCLRHLCFKFYDAFRNNLMTEFVYKAGSSRDTSSFDYYLKKIEMMNPEARKWLGKMALHQWALAHDEGGMRFGIMDTNTVFETYGFINSLRDLPITACILLIFYHTAELFISRRGLLGEKYAKHVTTKLEEYKIASRAHSVLPLDMTGERFQVTEARQAGKKIHFVHRSDRVCTCGIWQLYKYPCSHVLAVCRRLNIGHLQYVNEFYNTEASLGVYAAEFNPIPRVCDWPEAFEFLLKN